MGNPLKNAFKNIVLTQDCIPSGVGSHNFEITGYLKGHKTMENQEKFDVSRKSTMDTENIVNLMKSAEYENSVRDVSIAIKTVEILKDEETTAKGKTVNATDLTLKSYQKAYVEYGHRPSEVWQGVCSIRRWPFQTWDNVKGAVVKHKAPDELSDIEKKRLNSASATKSLIVKAMVEMPESWVTLKSMKALKEAIAPAPKTKAEKAWKAWNDLSDQERNDMLQSIVDKRGLMTSEIVGPQLAQAA